MSFDTLPDEVTPAPREGNRRGRRGCSGNQRGYRVTLCRLITRMRLAACVQTATAGLCGRHAVARVLVAASMKIPVEE
jgi:hypothetical protein